MKYIELVKGEAADEVLQERGWASYAEHVNDSGLAAGYYVGSDNVVELGAAEVAEALPGAVQVVSNIGVIFTIETVPVLALESKVYMLAEEFEELFL